MATNVPVTLDTLIVVKLQFQGNTRKFKIPLRDLGAQVLPEKLRALLQVPASEELLFERYSDSAGAYVTLDVNKPNVYKTLFRAAKAKLKLRVRATIPGQDIFPASVAPLVPVREACSSPPSSLHRMSAETLSAQGSPAIVRSPMPCTTPCSDQKPELEALANPLPTNTIDAEVQDEAPVPCSLTPRHSVRGSLTAANPTLPFKMEALQTSWVVYCNNCNLPMEDEHYHCGICDHGDYDLCPACVDAGIHCQGTGHWMVKRFVKNGSVVNSTTERVAPKAQAGVEQEMPGVLTEGKQPVTAVVEETHDEEPMRTCNSCVEVFRERDFVTCTSCEDFDLCQRCHVVNKHGHHPGHAFKAASAKTVMSPVADFLCNAGRNVRHCAICDGCEKFIYGVRHKCLNCPDWDFCPECIKSAKFIHPGHRFVPIYEPLAEPVNTGSHHHGIYCDGPLCKNKENVSYIEGVRFKCAVCHDTDYCAKCEAHPSNSHNHTHPLIKFKRPVRSVSVTTMNEDAAGKLINKVGDRERKSTATETIPVVPSTNAATQVHTVPDVAATEAAEPMATKEKIEIRDLLTKPVQEEISVQGASSTPVKAELAPVISSDSQNPDKLYAHFIRDTIADGSMISAGYQFIQVWTLVNPGPYAWPAGCSVRHAGGDNMLNLDNTQPLSHSELADASVSNVLGRPVLPGEEVSFRIILKAPAREGTAISYWRLKTADGTPFGHRLWCDIQVVSPPFPLSPPCSLPAEPAQASTSGTTFTPHKPFTQANLERFRVMRTFSQAQSMRIDKRKNECDATRVQEEALDRLRKLKLDLEEKESQTRSSEKVDREKMLRIQRVRKAAVERLLEMRRKEHKALTSLQQASEQKKAAEAANLSVTEKIPEVVEKSVELEQKAVECQPPLQASGMIFPQLEKESPVSSTHEALPAQPQAPSPGNVAVTATASEDSDEDFFEDAESVEVHSVWSDEGGFQTDEEYDILDASDEEVL